MTYQAIAGTTEHGSVDPLAEVLELRRSMERQGMSFMIHVDAAWGGYFALKAKPKAKKSPEPAGTFSIELNDWTYNQLLCLGHAEY
jgi:glutamate/tyrosine decarboxylase-like PLP-dependent enzyme